MPQIVRGPKLPGGAEFEKMCQNIFDNISILKHQSYFCRRILVMTSMIDTCITEKKMQNTCNLCLDHSVPHTSIQLTIPHC